MVVAVITAVPALTAVTLPFSSTVATDSLLDVHATSVPLGVATAVIFPVSFSFKVRTSLSNATFCFSFTTTVQVALTPCNVLTVMVAVPAPTTVTLPLSSTVTTSSLDEVQINVLFAGFTVAVRTAFSPSFNNNTF